MNSRKIPILPLCIAAAVLVAGVILFGFLHQTAQAAMPPAETTVPAVAVVKVARANLAQEVTIPAEFRPYEEVELHAKVSGYVKEMKVDFGDHVKAGQLLATLEIPELEADLTNALAAEQRADADYQDTHLAWTRLEAVNGAHPNLVAQQDLDVAQARDLAAAAAVAGARADVQKYRATVDYSRITAPFDGVITMRSADPGALIQAGTAANPEAKSLLHISDNYLLRLDFPVSVAYVQDVHAGDPVAARVESLGGRTFTGTITRFTDQVDESTRTMMTEIEVPNQDLELVPGMYCTVILQVNRHPAALAVPTAAVVSDKNPQVYVVNQNDQLEVRTVKLGVETPDQYEILSGLREGELVVIGNHAEVHAGQTVQPRLQAALTLNQ